MTLSGRCVVLGVSGGIAAYKACEVASSLKKLGANVRVVMTENATKFVSPLSFETLTGNACYVDQFEHAFEIEHISLAKSADLMLVAPATANIIGKYACGIADDLLSTVLMAMPASVPVLIAPAMNAAMYKSAANQANLRTLAGRGVCFVGPETGLLACGDDDIGRMSEPEAVTQQVVRLLCCRRDFEGKRVIVTAGPTREPLDPVRYLSNRSSGKMGYAIAEAAVARGAMVTLVSGPTALPPVVGAQMVCVTTTQDLFDALTDRAKDADVIIQAAAPADFRPAQVAPTKIKKTEDADTLRIELEKTPDVARALGGMKRPGQILVAFAAETDRAAENAREKLVRKNADLIVLNDVTKPGAGFDVDTNIATLIDAHGAVELPLMDKRELADEILDRVGGRWGAAPDPARS